MTAFGPLDSLPTETLSAVCDYLRYSHAPSLLSLGLANKRGYAIASIFLYRTIVFKADSPEQLDHDVQRCVYLLGRDSAFRHVRRFVVHGDGEFETAFLRSDKGAMAAQDDCGGYPLEWQRVPCAELIGSPHDSDEQAMESFITKCRIIKSGDRPSVGDVYRYDAGWRPLCRLVGLLPALTDFLFASPYQLPPCLLEALHKHFNGPDQNRLRLHIHGFHLLSLVDAEFDPHELALASSSLLHSVRVPYENTDGYDWERRPDYHLDAAIDMATGFAPNLREVRLYCDSGSTSDTRGYPLPTPPAWKGFPKDASTIDSLRYLELRGRDRWRPDFSPELPRHEIERWAGCIDLTVLQTLKLYRIVLPEALAFLAGCCRLPNLTTLTLDCEDMAGPEIAGALQRFLCSLPNLRSLELLAMGPLGTLGVAAFSPTLTRLRLPEGPETSYHEHLLPLIIQRCPLIEDLSVGVPRYRGGAPEVSLYRAIGSLPRLRRLRLRLDTGRATPEARAFMPRHAQSCQVKVPDLDAEITCGYLRGFSEREVYNALIDGAVDEKLAVAIFRAVAHGKKNARSGIAAVPLETLHIAVAGNNLSREMLEVGWAARRTLKRYLCSLGPDWRVTPDPRDDRHDVLHATLETRGMWNLFRRDAWLSQRPGHFDKSIGPIFRQIWPEKAEKSNWYEDWESWPLESLDDE